MVLFPPVATSGAVRGLRGGHFLHGPLLCFTLLILEAQDVLHIALDTYALCGGGDPRRRVGDQVLAVDERC